MCHLCGPHAGLQISWESRCRTTVAADYCFAAAVAARRHGGLSLLIRLTRLIRRVPLLLPCTELCRLHSELQNHDYCCGHCNSPPSPLWTMQRINTERGKPVPVQSCKSKCQARATSLQSSTISTFYCSCCAHRGLQRDGFIKFTNNCN